MGLLSAASPTIGSSFPAFAFYLIAAFVVMIPAIILLVVELPKNASWFVTVAAFFISFGIISLVFYIGGGDIRYMHYLIAFGIAAVTSITYNIITGIVVDDNLWPAVAAIAQELFTLGVMALLLFFA